MRPIIAVVGRPNVGKSTLFNRIVSGGQSAIVERQPGVTRDRLYADGDWGGRDFTVVDTGGLEGADDEFASLIADQAKAAIEEADLVLMLVDSRAGMLPDDDTIGEMLRHSHKPVILVANKSETDALAQSSQEFYRLGLGLPYPVSAAHGLGVGDMLDALVEALPPPGEMPEPEAPSGPVFAVLGRPNAGKSSLINSLVGAQRVITSTVPGTTRDAIDVRIEYNGEQLTLIDTAGLRRPSRVAEGLERFSVMRSLRAVNRSDIVWLLVDAIEGASDQERRIAGYVTESGRGLIIVINKIDLLDRPAGELARLQQKVRDDLYFVPWAPQVSISALTKEHIGRLLRVSMEVVASRQQRVDRTDLELMIRDSCLLRPPGTYRGRQIRFLGAEHLPGLPPAFAVYFSQPQAVAGPYLKYIENRLREVYSFTGAPLKVLARSKPRGLASVSNQVER